GHAAHPPRPRASTRTSRRTAALVRGGRRRGLGRSGIRRNPGSRRGDRTLGERRPAGGRAGPAAVLRGTRCRGSGASAGTLPADRGAPVDLRPRRPLPRPERSEVSRSMPDSSRREVRRLFLELAELPEAERPAALTRVCAGDPRLRTELEALLRADRDAGAFLARPTSGA